jgi:hypothetical protein
MEAARNNPCVITIVGYHGNPVYRVVASIVIWVTWGGIPWKAPTTGMITYTIYMKLHESYITGERILPPSQSFQTSRPPKIPDLPTFRNFRNYLTSQICRPPWPLKIFDLPNLPKFPTSLTSQTSWPSYHPKLSGLRNVPSFPTSQSSQFSWFLSDEIIIAVFVSHKGFCRGFLHDEQE